MSERTARRLNVIARLPGEFGQPLVIRPWWREAIERLDDPNIHELVLSLTRQTGKSQLLAAMAASELFTKPNAFVLMIAAGEEQANAIFDRKLRKPLEKLVRARGGVSRKEIVIGDGRIELPSSGAMLSVIPTSAVTAPGRSPTLLILDEARYISDDVFSVLLPSVIGGSGKVVVASSAGRPSGFFYNLVQNPTEHSWVYRSAVNDNVHASRGVLDFITRRLSLLVPAAARRELANDFVEDGETFLPAALIDAAVDDSLTEMAGSPLPAFAFLDLSRRRDLTSCVVVVRAAARRPEQADHLIAASVRVWDPRLSPTREVDFADVRAHLANLPARFPGLAKLFVDEGAEAGSVLPFARSMSNLSALVEGFRATPDANFQMWSSLSARLNAQTVSIPRHERLLAELRGLRQESFAFGSKWRIVDASSKFHRDVSLALAGACFAAGETPSLGPIPRWVHEANLAAPPTGAASERPIFGSSSGGRSLEDLAFGRSNPGGAFDLGKRGFGH